MKAFTFACIFWCVAGTALAETWQFEGAAIQDLGRVDRQTLFQVWLPIQLKDGAVPQVRGTFVSYQHEGLLYYFGPFIDENRAIQAQQDLEGLRARLIALDAKFETSSVATVKTGTSTPESTNRNSERPETGSPPSTQKPVPDTNSSTDTESSEKNKTESGEETAVTPPEILKDSPVSDELSTDPQSDSTEPVIPPENPSPSEDNSESPTSSEQSSEDSSSSTDAPSTETSEDRSSTTESGSSSSSSQDTPAESPENGEEPLSSQQEEADQQPPETQNKEEESQTEPSLESAEEGTTPEDQTGEEEKPVEEPTAVPSPAQEASVSTPQPTPTSLPKATTVPSDPEVEDGDDLLSKDHDSIKTNGNRRYFVAGTAIIIAGLLAAYAGLTRS